MPPRTPSDRVGHDIDGPSIVAFAVELDTEFSSPPHSHPRGQMIGCSWGVVTIRGDRGAWAVPAGHAIWLPPFTVHGGQSFGPGAGWSVYVAPHACDSLPDQPRTVRVPPLLREAVLRAAAWEDGALDGGQQRIADLIVNEIGNLPAEELGLPMPRDPRLLRVAQALLADLADERTIEAWATWAGSTPRTLSRRFPHETGMSFTAWRQRARLMRSLELLAEGHPVTTIAFDLGYSSVSGFIALFRRTFGVTPTAHPIVRTTL